MTFLNDSKGFSLVELSIVLVILGLLTGGILGGQSLIHAAELRAVTKEHEAWSIAVNTFKDKYFAIPGDMRNATDFWGAADTSDGGECGDPGNDTGTGTETCNGDGGGFIDDDYEQFRFWQHLANAGLITGTYSGTEGPDGASHAVIGTNIPASKYNSGGWSTGAVGYHPGNTWWFEGEYGHIFRLGIENSPWTASQPVAPPEDAWNIDKKLDDGKPGTGSVRIENRNICTDSAAADDWEADYLLTTSVDTCTIMFTNAF